MRCRLAAKPTVRAVQPVYQERIQRHALVDLVEMHDGLALANYCAIGAQHVVEPGLGLPVVLAHPGVPAVLGLDVHRSPLGDGAAEGRLKLQFLQAGDARHRDAGYAMNSLIAIAALAGLLVLVLIALAVIYRERRRLQRRGSSVHN